MTRDELARVVAQKVNEFWDHTDLQFEIAMRMRREFGDLDVGNFEGALRGCCELSAAHRAAWIRDELPGIVDRLCAEFSG
jgi:hypothetical protein